MEVQQTHIPRVAMPTMTPEGGAYAAAPTVTMTTATAEATIRYTLNGNIPTEESTQYTAAVVVLLGSTVTARAFKAGWAESHVSEVQVYVSDEPAPVSAGTVSAAPSIATGFAAVSGSAVFELTGAFLSTDPGDVVAYRGQTLLPVLIPNPTSFQVGSLQEGANRLDIFGIDSQDLPFELTAVVWAGSRTLTVTVRDRSQQPLSGVTVGAALGEEGAIQAPGTTTSSGIATLSNTPTPSELWVTATAPGYRARSALVGAGQTSLTLTLDSTNLDFSEGLIGWTNTAAVMRPSCRTPRCSQAGCPVPRASSERRPRLMAARPRIP